MEGGGLRKRRSHDERRSESPLAATPPAAASSATKHATGRRTPMAGRAASLLLHALAIACYLFGVVQKEGSLHTGDECEMTYSYRHFVEIATTAATPASRAADGFRLYKFVDRRDPRYQHLLVPQQQADGSSSSPAWRGPGHCPSAASTTNGSNETAAAAAATIVLYVPGHWGSFGQARSVGAHGTRMTRARQDTRRILEHLRAGTRHGGSVAQQDDFVYDVYAVDFAEQGGALHGRFLELQSDFVAGAVRQLSKDCGVPTVTLVAHSMGGYVARLVPIRHPDTKPLVPNIVTLATPHASPLYSFDRSIHRLHETILQDGAASTMVVSISGGYRDEMIEPNACRVTGPSSDSSRSYLFPMISEDTTRLGMDHRAVVWCHGILEEVRALVWGLAGLPHDASLPDRLRRTEEILEHPASYEEDMRALSERFQSIYGYWRGCAMESAMWYNLPILYGFYAIVSGLSWALPHDQVPSWGPALAALAAGCVWSEASVPALAILALLANAIHLLLVRLLPQGFLSPSTGLAGFLGKALLATAVLLAALGLAALRFFGVPTDQWGSVGHWECLAYALGVASAYLCCAGMLGSDRAGSHHHHHHKAALAAMLVLLLPGVFAGALVLMVWEQAVHADSWWLLAWILVPVVLAASHDRERRSPALALVVLAACPWIPSRGNAYRVVPLVVAVASAEALVGLFGRTRPKPGTTEASPSAKIARV